MKAFVFIRPSSPQFLGHEFGHVGWGFETLSGSYMIGAVENTKGMPIAHPDKMDFWSKEVNSPFKTFSEGPLAKESVYDLYKELTVSKPTLVRALIEIDKVRKKSYNVLNQNCMHSTFDILNAYGAVNLPNPNELENIAPATWFQKIGAPSQVLMDSNYSVDFSIYEHPEMMGSVKRFRGAEDLQLPDLREEALGFTISSIVNKSGHLKVFKKPFFKGGHIEIGPQESMKYLNEWDNTIQSMKISNLGIEEDYMLEPFPPKSISKFDCSTRVEVFNF